MRWIHDLCIWFSRCKMGGTLIFMDIMGVFCGNIWFLSNESFCCFECHAQTCVMPPKKMMMNWVHFYPNSYYYNHFRIMFFYVFTINAYNDFPWVKKENKNFCSCEFIWMYFWCISNCPSRERLNIWSCKDDHVSASYELARRLLTCRMRSNVYHVKWSSLSLNSVQ